MEDTELLIYLIAFGGITGAIAKKKGRNFWGWFFFGFLFNIIALLISLVITNKNKPKRKSWKQRYNENVEKNFFETEERKELYYKYEKELLAIKHSLIHEMGSKIDITPQVCYERLFIDKVINEDEYKELTLLDKWKSDLLKRR